MVLKSDNPNINVNQYCRGSALGISFIHSDENAYTYVTEIDDGNINNELDEICKKKTGCNCSCIYAYECHFSNLLKFLSVIKKDGEWVPIVTNIYIVQADITKPFFYVLKFNDDATDTEKKVIAERYKTFSIWYNFLCLGTAKGTGEDKINLIKFINKNTKGFEEFIRDMNNTPKIDNWFEISRDKDKTKTFIKFTKGPKSEIKIETIDDYSIKIIKRQKKQLNDTSEKKMTFTITNFETYIYYLCINSIKPSKEFISKFYNENIPPIEIGEIEVDYDGDIKLENSLYNPYNIYYIQTYHNNEIWLYNAPGLQIPSETIDGEDIKVKDENDKVVELSENVYNMITEYLPSLMKEVPDKIGKKFKSLNIGRGSSKWNIKIKELKEYFKEVYPNEDSNDESFENKAIRKASQAEGLSEGDKKYRVDKENIIITNQWKELEKREYKIIKVIEEQNDKVYWGDFLTLNKRKMTYFKYNNKDKDIEHVIPWNTIRSYIIKYFITIDTNSSLYFLHLIYYFAYSLNVQVTAFNTSNRSISQKSRPEYILNRWRKSLKFFYQIYNWNYIRQKNINNTNMDDHKYEKWKFDKTFKLLENSTHGTKEIKTLDDYLTLFGENHKSNIENFKYKYYNPTNEDDDINIKNFSDSAKEYKENKMKELQESSFGVIKEEEELTEEEKLHENCFLNNDMYFFHYFHKPENQKYRIENNFSFGSLDLESQFNMRNIIFDLMSLKFYRCNIADFEEIDDVLDFTMKNIFDKYFLIKFPMYKQLLKDSITKLDNSFDEFYKYFDEPKIDLYKEISKEILELIEKDLIEDSNQLMDTYNNIEKTVYQKILFYIKHIIDKKNLNLDFIIIFLLAFFENKTQDENLEKIQFYMYYTTLNIIETYFYTYKKKFKEVFNDDKKMEIEGKNTRGRRDSMENISKTYKKGEKSGKGLIEKKGELIEYYEQLKKLNDEESINKKRENFKKKFDSFKDEVIKEVQEIKESIYAEQEAEEFIILQIKIPYLISSIETVNFIKSKFDRLIKYLNDIYCLPCSLIDTSDVETTKVKNILDFDTIQTNIRQGTPLNQNIRHNLPDITERTQKTEKRMTKDEDNTDTKKNLIENFENNVIKVEDNKNQSTITDFFKNRKRRLENQQEGTNLKPRVYTGSLSVDTTTSNRNPGGLKVNTGNYFL